MYWANFISKMRIVFDLREKCSVTKLEFNLLRWEIFGCRNSLIHSINNETCFATFSPEKKNAVEQAHTLDLIKRLNLCIPNFGQFIFMIIIVVAYRHCNRIMRINKIFQMNEKSKKSANTKSKLSPNAIIVNNKNNKIRGAETDRVRDANVLQT